MDHAGTICVKMYSSPCGEMVLGSCCGQLCLCDWAGHYNDKVYRRLARELRAGFVEGVSDTILEASKQLDAYFHSGLKEFDIPVLFAGTDFQKKVWTALVDIPYGKTVTYGEIARAIGSPSAVRAVAGAIGANAVSIVVPCHRVVASDGRTGGYRGGTQTKQRLLLLERSICSLSDKDGLRRLPDATPDPYLLPLSCG